MKASTLWFEFTCAVNTVRDHKSSLFLEEMVVSQTFTSWNQIAAWLRRIEGIRVAA